MYCAVKEHTWNANCSRERKTCARIYFGTPFMHILYVIFKRLPVRFEMCKHNAHIPIFLTRRRELCLLLKSICSRYFPIEKNTHKSSTKPWISRPRAIFQLWNRLRKCFSIFGARTPRNRGDTSGMVSGQNIDGIIGIGGNDKPSLWTNWHWFQ